MRDNSNWVIGSIIISTIWLVANDFIWAMIWLIFAIILTITNIIENEREFKLRKLHHAKLKLLFAKQEEEERDNKIRKKRK